MFSLLLVRLAHAGCEAPTTPSQIDGTLQEAILAYVAGDVAGMQDLARRAEAEVGCLGSKLEPAQVAAFDRVDAIRLFTEGDVEGARASFVAARALDPDTRLSERVAPAGSELERLYVLALDAPDSATEFVDVAPGNIAWVDGKAGAERPTAVVSVVQVGPGAAALKYSAVIRARQPLELPKELQPSVPTATVAAALPPAPTEKATVEKKRSPAATPLWVAAGVSALAAGGCFAASVYTNLQFAEEPDPTTLGINHGTWYGAVGLGGATVVLAGVAVAVSL